MTERYTLDAMDIRLIGNFLTDNLDLYDDNTCDYTNSYSDAKVADIFHDKVTTSHVANLRKRLYGNLRSRPARFIIPTVDPAHFHRLLQIVREISTNGDDYVGSNAGVQATIDITKMLEAYEEPSADPLGLEPEPSPSPKPDTATTLSERGYPKSDETAP